MAILSKIRDRSMFLILIVGLALFAFVLDPTSIQSFFSTSKINAIGAVNGDDIDREVFLQEVEAYKSQRGASVTQIQAVNDVWNAMVSEKIFEEQLEGAGIVVGEKDIWDAITELPQIQNSPLFKNEANLFDEDKLKEYIANIEASGQTQTGQSEWYNWLATERAIKQNLERQAYTSLVSAGLGASIIEGEREYKRQNTKMDAQFVYVPFTTIADSLGFVSRDEISSYIKKNKNRYQPEATRSLEYVRFDIVPSEEDDANVKEEVAKLIEDTEEYNTASKEIEPRLGLKNETDYELFFEIQKSDLNLDTIYKFKSQVFAPVSDEIFDAEIGDVVGPYKQNGIYKISKVIEKIQIPDSVKSSHIIVPYAGATRSTSLKTKEEAKKSIDSIYQLVRRNKAKFTEVADEINSDGTKGKGGDIGWVRKNQAFGPAFDRAFADYIFFNNEGSIGIVESNFGYHIIRVDEQTEDLPAVSLVTYGKSVDPSDETENDIFQEAETLASNLDKGQSLFDAAAEKEYKIENALNLKVLDEAIPGLSNQRQIVTWAFDDKTELGDFQRFDVDVNGQRAYAVVVLKNRTEEDGVVISSDLLSQIRPELINKKKAELIIDDLKGNTLEEIASSANTSVRNASSVTLASPTLTGVGNEPKVVAAMSVLNLEENSDFIIGEKGVFVVKVTKREEPTELDNYESFRKAKALSYKAKAFILYQVLEKSADIKDNRGKFF